jgi:hypothetical protein
VIVQYGAKMFYFIGEQGKVEESMREMAAIEALKSEKSEKEVGISFPSIVIEVELIWTV